MIAVAKARHLLAAPAAQLLNHDEGNRVLTFERGGLVFVFNFHPELSLPDYGIPVPKAGRYQLILNSDDAAFGGFGRVDNTVIYDTLGGGGTLEAPRLSLYVTNRTALVLRAEG